MKRIIVFLALVASLALAGCAVPTTGPAPVSAPAATPPSLSAKAAARQFVDVVETVEPVAEAECRRLTPQQNCDFLIAVDDRPNVPPNAFQTLDKSGRPVIAFTLALIAEIRNQDELAFVMSHEAAHHIEGHIAQTQRNAVTGAVLLGQIAALTGAGPQGVRSAQEIGAQVGARTYSKDFELEADALGTVIAKRAGYDPVRGAAYFTRIPDPGNRFLGTHPPNADRIKTVQQVAAGL